jgi:hypothetical protein
MSAKDGYRPSALTFDRRACTAYEKNVHFSIAPLKTADHLKVLAILERLFT